MFHDIVQGFLDDAVDRDFLFCRQIGKVAQRLNVHLDAEAAAPLRTKCRQRFVKADIVERRRPEIGRNLMNIAADGSGQRLQPLNFFQASRI